VRRRLYIPDEVKTSIREHLSGALSHAAEGYLSSHEDEDAITGDLGGTLRSGVKRVYVVQSQTEIRGEWKWSITYSKFRGRGPRATESFVGADGIFELDIQSGSRRDQKSILFQAKVAGAADRGLLGQALKLTTWREAAFVLVYSETGYVALSLDDVIADRGIIRDREGIPLAKYLGTSFLDCDVGDDELHYDSRRRRLIWRTMEGQVLAVSFSARHRIAFKIEAPRWGDGLPSIGREVRPDEIHNFRMQATDDDVLSLRGHTSPRDVGKARARLALIYHPDLVGELADEAYDRILTRRMQEINAAVDRKRRK